MKSESSTNIKQVRVLQVPADGPPSTCAPASPAGRRREGLLAPCGHLVTSGREGQGRGIPSPPPPRTPVPSCVGLLGVSSPGLSSGDLPVVTAMLPEGAQHGEGGSHPRPPALARRHSRPRCDGPGTAVGLDKGLPHSRAVGLMDGGDGRSLKLQVPAREQCERLPAVEADGWSHPQPPPSVACRCPSPRASYTPPSHLFTAGCDVPQAGGPQKTGSGSSVASHAEHTTQMPGLVCSVNA